MPSIIAILGLAIYITQIGAARDAAANPAIRRHLLNKVLGLLDIITNRLNEGLKHSVKALLRNSAALLALTNLLGMEKHGLHVGISTTHAHEGHRQKGASLRTD
jgi:hypothetical protein